MPRNNSTNNWSDSRETAEKDNSPVSGATGADDQALTPHEWNKNQSSLDDEQNLAVLWLIAETESRPHTILSHPADHVKGSKEFDRIYQSLRQGSAEKRMVDSALDMLKQNMMLGDKIQRPQWPPYYVRRYAISNLWKFNMPKAARLIYTLLSENGRWVVIVLEMFLTHEEYEKRFGYCQSVNGPGHYS